MAWIESHQALRNHPKLKKASRLLGVREVAIVGHLHCLWWWALDHAQDGDLTDFDPEDIALVAEWDGDPVEFIRVMVDCGPGPRAGFMEYDGDRLLLHDWFDYAGRLIESRRHHAGQKRKHRELYNDRGLCASIRERDGDRCRYCSKETNWNDRRGGDGGTYDYVDPFGPTTLENLVVACRACNAGKNQRTPEEAGYVLQPPPTDTRVNPLRDGQKPTPTGPNTTVPNQPLSPSKDGKKRKRQIPDSWHPNEKHYADNPNLDVDAQAESFRDHAIANSRTLADWDAGFRNWLRKAHEIGGTSPKAREPEPIQPSHIDRNLRRARGEACVICNDTGYFEGDDNVAHVCNHSEAS